jgi:predicted RNA-binding protein with PUA-like domain
MPAWLLKTEPDDYALDDLQRDKSTRWDGVTNNAALKHIRSASKGEMAFIYHTGKEKAVVGIAKLTSDPYVDPASDDERHVVFDVRYVKRLKQPVTLAEIKAEPTLANWELVRQSRLSVVPTPPEVWQWVESRGTDQDA